MGRGHDVVDSWLGAMHATLKMPFAHRSVYGTPSRHVNAAMHEKQGAGLCA